MQFEWDIEKEKINFKKHNVAFSEAETVFCNPLAKVFLDEWHSADEKREWIVGHSTGQRLLIVAFTEREGGVIRIISAGLATRIERKDYEDG
jgi:uncharacterized protein